MRAPCPSNVDLLQVDLMSFCIGREAGRRATKSRGVSRYIKSDERLFLMATSNVARVRILGFSPCPVSVFSVLQSSLRCSRCFSSNTAVFRCLQKPLHKFFFHLEPTNSC